MYKLFTLLFLSFTLFGATPNLYKAIGDPIYQQVPSVNKISEIGYFKTQKKEFKDFVNRAKRHKELGFKYDKLRANRTLSKAQQKAYLGVLRDLDKELLSINVYAKDALEVFVKRHYVSSFYQLKASKISVLRRDKESAWLVKKYSKDLEKQKKLNAHNKIKRDQLKAKNYRKMLRSAKNLNGIWKGKSSDGSLLRARFKADTLSLSYTKEEKEHILKGTYKIKKNFTFLIKSRILIISQKEHVRTLNIKREYLIKKISNKELILKFKDETLNLKR